MRCFFKIVESDFKERSRRFSFLAMAALMLLAAYLLIPNPRLGYEVLCVERRTFLQGTDPTWIPMGAALALSAFLPIFGFVFIKNAIETDKKSGVLALIQSSNISRFTYMAGKCTSNFLLLISLILIEMTGTLFMTALRFPGQSFTAWSFFSPFVALLPGIAVICALALLSEVLPGMGETGGGIMGVAALFVFFVVSLNEATKPDVSPLLRLLDFGGITWLMDSIGADTYRAAGIARPSFSVIDFSPASPAGRQELVFSGLAITPEALLKREPGCFYASF